MTSNPFRLFLNGSNIILQSAAFWYVPILIVLAVLSWIYLRRIPVEASFKEQLDIFSNKHTWFCPITYMMTFGTFARLSAAFPLLIKILYGDFEGAPDPLVYAFYGPLIGSASRVLFGFVADKTGGAILTTITDIELAIGVTLLINIGLVAPAEWSNYELDFKR